MQPELNLDYIKLILKEVKTIANFGDEYALKSVRRKAQMVLDHISQAEKDHLKALDELEKDMQMFRDDPGDMYYEAADYKGEIVG